MVKLKYIQGSSHVFAVALNKELGYPIQLKLDRSDPWLKREVLIHAYCVKGDKAVDVRGKMCLESVIDDFEYNEPYTKNVTVEEIGKLIEEGFLREYTKAEINRECYKIRNNIERFKVD